MTQRSRDEVGKTSLSHSAYERALPIWTRSLHSHSGPSDPTCGAMHSERLYLRSRGVHRGDNAPSNVRVAACVRRRENLLHDSSLARTGNAQRAEKALRTALISAQGAELRSGISLGT